MDAIKKNFDDRGKFDKHAYARTITEGVGIYDRQRVYLMDEIFRRPGIFLKALSDTAGIIVHELFHIAGCDDPLIDSLNADIHKYCRTIGSDPF